MILDKNKNKPFEMNRKNIYHGINKIDIHNFVILAMKINVCKKKSK